MADADSPFRDAMSKKDKADMEKSGLMFQELMEENDRSVAVLGGAYLDEALEEAILSRLHDCKSSKWLVDGSLGSFAARIAFARSIGLIGEETLGEMLKIKLIRNEFAHRTVAADSKGALAKVSFKTKKIASICHHLKTAQRIQVHKKLPGDPKTRYVFTIINMVGQLWNEMVHNKVPPLPTSNFLP